MRDTITEADLRKLLATPLGSFQPKRRMCGRCGTIEGHPLIHCPNCGGEFVLAGEWPIGVFFSRFHPKKKHTIRGWLPTLLAYQFEKDFGQYFTAYRFCCEHEAALWEMYEKIQQG